MFELSIEQLKLVAGGRVADTSGNDYGDNQNGSGIQWTNRKLGEPGLGSAISGILSAKAHPVVGLAIFGAAHYAETRDYERIGEDYKNYVNNQLQRGLFHQD